MKPGKENESWQTERGREGQAKRREVSREWKGEEGKEIARRKDRGENRSTTRVKEENEKG